MGKNRKRRKWGKAPKPFTNRHRAEWEAEEEEDPKAKITIEVPGEPKLEIVSSHITVDCERPTIDIKTFTNDMPTYLVGKREWTIKVYE